jgi:hypothetical protein
LDSNIPEDDRSHLHDLEGDYIFFKRRKRILSKEENIEK